LKLTEKLKQVQKENRALLAANFYNLETCRGILKAAGAVMQPLILQLTPSSATDTKDLFMKTLKDIMKNSDDIDLRNVFPLAINEIQKMIEQKIKIVSMIN